GWNQCPEGAREYMKLVKATVPVIRQECPQCKIMLGSTGGFGPAAQQFIKTCIDEGVGRLVDAIGFHPFYDTDLGSEYYTSYPQRFREFKAYAEARGFRGNYMASEHNWTIFPLAGQGLFRYEHGGEMRHTKSILRSFVTHLGLGVYAFYCETWNSAQPWNLGLLRVAFASN